MLIEHRGIRPSIHPDAYVASTAVIVGDVAIAGGARVMHGAVLNAEDGQVRIGKNTVIMENTVIRGRSRHSVFVGNSVMVGPHAHLNGTVVEDEAFIATGASLFPGSRVGGGAEVRVNGVVQVNTQLPPGSTVPIGWVAVGDPARILPPERHDEIWEIQRQLDFPGTVYGVDRTVSMGDLMSLQSEYYGSHRGDTVVEPSRGSEDSVE